MNAHVATIGETKNPPPCWVASFWPQGQKSEIFFAIFGLPLPQNLVKMRWEPKTGPFVLHGEAD